MRFLPLGGAGPRRDDARFGFAFLPRRATTRTDRQRRLVGLPLQRLIAHLPRHGLTDLHGEFFNVCEAGSPFRSLGTVDPIREVFGHALDQITQFIYLLCSIWFSGHPRFLSGVASQSDSIFPTTAYDSPTSAANHVVHPMPAPMPKWRSWS